MGRGNNGNKGKNGHNGNYGNGCDRTLPEHAARGFIV